MSSFLQILATMIDLLVVILGFSFIVFIHELGHFIAARWAGVRVLGFAIGFGPAVCSYRRGMGLCKGSSAPEYAKLAEHRGSHLGVVDGSISPTEYRLNWLPLGGYVKMLGQDDLDPSAISQEPDSYQTCPAGKRMVIISAGVVMNLILAAILFVIVFMIGLKTEPPKIGRVLAGTPAALAQPLPGGPLNERGIRPGDEILSVNGRPPASFNDLVIASAMSGPDESLRLVVQRPGVSGQAAFDVTPEPGELTGLMEIGVEPHRSATLFNARNEAEGELLRKVFDRIGAAGLEPGMTLTSVNGAPPTYGAYSIALAADASDGQPLALTFESNEGRSISVEVDPAPQLQVGSVDLGAEKSLAQDHVLGLMPVMRVESADKAGQQKGLRDGDIFARIGSVEFPSLAQGIAEIRAHAGSKVDLLLLRDGTMVPLRVGVSRAGRIGFRPGDTGAMSTLMARPVEQMAESDGSNPAPPAALSLLSNAGTTIVAIDGVETPTIGDVREALRSATRDAFESGLPATVDVVLELPFGFPDPQPRQTASWELAYDDLEALHGLGWRSPLGLGLFAPEEFVLKADNPIDAIGKGLGETRRVMLMTYVTLARLFQGTVKVEHLKGPVGIAHIGTRLASRGPVWLIFFMALISVNLAVVNFLPLPVVDGGQFIFLLIERIRGRPVSVEIQNVAAIAGLALIVAIFLVVTFNDIRAIFGG